jgi:hypothetical protein
VAQLAAGAIADRPWGRTLAQVGLRKVSGELAVHAETGEVYRLAFDLEHIIGAQSPHAADTAAQIAATGKLVPKNHLAAMEALVAAHPADDDIDLVVAMCRLDPMGAIRFRRKVLEQRTARTFLVDRGRFVLEDAATIHVSSYAAVDVRRRCAG